MYSRLRSRVTCKMIRLMKINLTYNTINVTIMIKSRVNSAA